MNDEVKFGRLSLMTMITHTVTYFVAGLLALVFLDYARLYADPGLRSLMRQTTDPWVAAGPLLQPIRGLIFALAFYPLRSVLFGKKNGWLVMWLLLVSIGILSTFGPAPGSVEGMIYTTIPFYYQLIGLPEVLLQSFLFSVILCYWVNNPANRKLAWSMVVLLLLGLSLSVLGLLMPVRS